MPKTRNEKLEYGRGYNRGIARAYDRFKAVVEIAKGYRRAARGEGPHESICKNCDRWKRGEGNAHWGRCRADFEWDLEPRMWSDAWPAKEKAEIITQPEFGCISWVPKEGQERTLPDVAGNVPASKPYDPSIKPAAGGSNACGETVPLAPAGARVDD